MKSHNVYNIDKLHPWEYLIYLYNCKSMTVCIGVIMDRDTCIVRRDRGCDSGSWQVCNSEDASGGNQY